MSEDQEEYITDAVEMLGKGYEPTLEIEEARKVTERRGNKLVEAERSAFVKIYTSFKSELKDIDGDDLKVWIYLALSINRQTKDARPGLRKIAEDTGMAVNTVRSSIERLEVLGLLDVEKVDGKGNVYRPSDYVSVSKFDTVTQTVSKNTGTVSKNDGTVSASRKDFAQLEELELTRKEGDVLDGIIHYQLKPKAIRDAFAKYFRLTPNWEAKYTRQFLEWAVEIQMTPEQVQSAADLWRKDKRFNWSIPTLKGIQEHWLELTEKNVNYQGNTGAEPSESDRQLAERIKQKRLQNVS